MFCQLVFAYGLMVMGGQGKSCIQEFRGEVSRKSTGVGWGGMVALLEYTEEGEGEWLASP